jgi:hypothetical protein
MRRLVLLILLAASPMCASYGFLRSVTVDHTQTGTSDSLNFPVLFTGTYSYLATVANSGNVTSSSGYDIIFTSDSGCSTPLNFERVIYTAASGLVEFWINVPTLSHTSDTVFYVCYGNAAVTTDQSNKSATWNGAFEMVDHFGDGATMSASDSTGNANNGTNTSVTAASGQIGGAASFNGSSSFIQVANSSSLNAWTAQTISIWVDATVNMGDFARVVEKGNNNEWTTTFNGTHNSNEFGVQCIGTGIASNNTSVITGAWHKVDVTLSANTSATEIVYVDGAQVASFGCGSTPSSLTHDIFIGRGGSGIQFYTGIMDELRISNVVRSSAWILAEYNNQHTPSSCYTIGSGVLAVQRVRHRVNTE